MNFERPPQVKTMRYDIYAGVESRELNTVRYRRSMLCEDEQEAITFAKCFAVLDYEKHAGKHSLLSWQDIREERRTKGQRFDDEAVDTFYSLEVEEKIVYYVEKS